jgi:hypothetical protein
LIIARILKAMLQEMFRKAICSAEISCHLYIAGVGDAFQTKSDQLIVVFQQFGELDDTAVHLVPHRKYCFVSFKSVESAVAAVKFFETSRDMTTLLGVATIAVRFAIEKKPSSAPPYPECTSVTDSTILPGCFLLSDFVTEEEHDSILQEFGDDSSTWKESLSRRVQVVHILPVKKTLICKSTHDILLFILVIIVSILASFLTTVPEC